MPFRQTPRAARAVVAIALLFVTAIPLAAQELPLTRELTWPGVTGYRADVPTPDDVLGYTIGERHTAPHEVVAYFRAVAQASDRVTLQEHGRTYEGRPLIHATVTAPSNHARLGAIKAQNRRLSDAPADVADAELEQMPAVAYMGYSIHGNEASGTEAAVLLLYHLAAGQGTAVDEVLDHVVTIVDPLFNPDGRDRFVDWVNRNRGAVATTDPDDREHNEPWPGGRTNHYWFDLNRDWLPAAHPESQGRLAVFHDWRPQVLTDFHEMGGDATYFFQPGIPSRTNPNTPAINQVLTGRIAEYNADALDRIGSLYYTEESFDDFYYGKGSTYPDVQGTIGILFEQASSRALQRETQNGVLDYGFTVRNQLAASLGTLQAIAEMREDLLRYQRDVYAEAPEVARANEVQAYVIGLDGDRTKAQALAQLLQRHRVRLHTLARDVEADGYAFEAGEAYVVPMDQPQVRLLKGVMEPMTTFEDSLFYDVSTWTLPLAFDLDMAELEEVPAGLLGPALGPVGFDGGSLIGGEARYAYLLPWDRYFAPRALYKLQAAGIRPRLTTDPFTAMVEGEPMPFERGTIVVPVVQPGVPADSVHALIGRVVQEDHVRAFAVDGGLTPSGPDLGGRGVNVLRKPTVALVTGSGASSYNAGEVWHLLSERFGIPVSLLDTDAVGDADLDRYTTIVVAGGYYNGLPAEEIKAWVRAGGTLVALDSGAEWAVRNDFAELEERAIDLDSLYRDLPYDQVSLARGAQGIGGAIFEARLDPTHPLAYGLGEALPVFRNGTTFYEPSDAPGTNVARYADEPLLSGYVSEEVLEHVPGAAAAVAERMGQGRVVLLMDNPNFRAFWWGTNKLFLNALFFGQSF